MSVSVASRVKLPEVHCGHCSVTCSWRGQSCSIASKSKLGSRACGLPSCKYLTSKFLKICPRLAPRCNSFLYLSCFRLTAVILQEQKFADEFLVTPRARQCIGQACRTALISPLIETLATRSHSKRDGLSSLSLCQLLNYFLSAEEGLNLTQLVKDYLHQMSPPVAIQWRALATAVSLSPIQVGTIASHDFVKDQERLVQV